MFADFTSDLYRQLLDSSSDPIFCFAPDYRYLYANQAFADGIGRKLDQIIGRTVWDVFPEDLADIRYALVKGVFDHGEAKVIEIPVPGPTGDHYYLTTLTPLRDDQGEVRYVLANSKDITERKRAEAELLAAKSAAESASLTKSRFLAAASHDLRQPAQAIKLFADSLSKTELDAEQKRISDYLLESTQSLCDQLNILLDISTLDAGVVKFNPRLIRADALFSKIRTEFSSLATEKNLRFKASTPPRGMALMTDIEPLMNLLANLIGNAVKYTRQGGILVTIRRRGNQALIQVWDTGSGIAPEHLGNIFEEYFQVENPERDRAKGLGLGLAIVRRVATLLETEVVCRSRPGKGSVFEFRVPLVSREEIRSLSSHGTPAIISEAKPSGRHIVLVEDNLLVGAATKLVLESCGMTVTLYKTAEEALADAAIADADFYISDFRLPGMNGIEFLDAVQQRAIKPIKAVVVTGDKTISRDNEKLRATTWQVMFKPFDLSRLLSAIESQYGDD